MNQKEFVLHYDDGSQYQSSQLARAQLKQAIKLEETKIAKDKDKKDRQTHAQVFDKITIRNLNKFYVNDIINKIDTFVIFSGKEANIYHTTDFQDNIKEYAVKIYKTMILSFKEREQYITGEFWFRRRTKNTRTNPHKLIWVWAEKEFRNLKKLQNVGIRVPEAIYLRGNVLLMEFIGKDKIPAQRLRDIDVDQHEFEWLYINTIWLLRRMYVEAKLVHGDFSEYNVLYHQNQLVVIDVSQAMETAHPMALEFLKRDIFNINVFFQNQGVKVYYLRDLFQIITGSDLSIEKVQNRLNNMAVQTQDQKQNLEELFMDINIPQTLFDFNLNDLDRILDKKLEEQKFIIEEEEIYKHLTGLNIDQDNHSESNEEEESEDSCYEDSQENTQGGFDSLNQEKTKKNLTKEEIKEINKQNKKQVKEENWEKRKTKMKKTTKQTLVNKSKR